MNVFQKALLTSVLVMLLVASVFWVYYTFGIAVWLGYIVTVFAGLMTAFGVFYYEDAK